MKFRVGGLRAPLWGVVGSRERERGDLRGKASLRFSGVGPGTGAAGGLCGWGGLGLGLVNSSSDSRLKSWRSLWGRVIGLDPGEEGREDERGRFLGGGLGLVLAETACCSWGGKVGAA